MEIGELVAVPMPEQPVEDECPFSHEKPNPTEKNELGGIGTTLGKNMASGKGINTSATAVDFTKGDEDLDPWDRSGASRITGVTICVNGGTVTLKGTPLRYPVTCAAHHLIPAQESLKKHKILKFMCKDGESQDFRNGKEAEPAAVPGSAVWGNVAYNVNGCQNGVWLPGNYAVGAGVGAVEVWKSRAAERSTYTDQEAARNWEKRLDLGPDDWKPLSDPKENEEPQPATLAAALASTSVRDYMLAGTNYHIVPGNPKWGYVKAAMDAVHGQFHDRHETYSTAVKGYLDKVAEAYEQMLDRSQNKENPCQKCKDAERPAGAKASLVGPPYAIVARLSVASQFFKQYVGKPRVTARNIYTSKWIPAWIESEGK